MPVTSPQLQLKSPEAVVAALRPAALDPDLLAEKITPGFQHICSRSPDLRALLDITASHSYGWSRVLAYAAAHTDWSFQNGAMWPSSDAKIAVEAIRPHIPLPITPSIRGGYLNFILADHYELIANLRAAVLLQINAACLYSRDLQGKLRIYDPNFLHMDERGRAIVAELGKLWGLRPHPKCTLPLPLLLDAASCPYFNLERDGRRRLLIIQARYEYNDASNSKMQDAALLFGYQKIPVVASSRPELLHYLENVRAQFGGFDDVLFCGHSSIDIGPERRLVNKEHVRFVLDDGPDGFLDYTSFDVWKVLREQMSGDGRAYVGSCYTAEGGKDNRRNFMNGARRGLQRPVVCGDGVAGTSIVPGLNGLIESLINTKKDKVTGNRGSPELANVYEPLVMPPRP